jgi:hypothetical protein
MKINEYLSLTPHGLFTLLHWLTWWQSLNLIVHTPKQRYDESISGSACTCMVLSVWKPPCEVLILGRGVLRRIGFRSSGSSHGIWRAASLGDVPSYCNWQCNQNSNKRDRGSSLFEQDFRTTQYHNCVNFADICGGYSCSETLVQCPKHVGRA